MPLYTIFAEDGSLPNKTKAKIAQEITRMHAEVMKVKAPAWYKVLHDVRGPEHPSRRSESLAAASDPVIPKSAHR